MRLTCSGVHTLTAAPELAGALGKPPDYVAALERDAHLAQSEVDKGFATIFAQAIIVAWGALETAVRDFLVRWLATFPSARQSPAVSKIRIRFGDYEALSPGERMEYLLSELERELGAPLQPGVGRFESLLSALSIGGPVDPVLRRDLLELAATRNVLVHRAGVADERFVALCPWLGLQAGAEVRVSQEQYHRHLGAVYRYAGVIVRRAKTVGGTLIGGA